MGKTLLLCFVHSITAAVATHLPSVNKPLDVLYLHKFIWERLSETVKLTPTALELVPHFLQAAFVDLLALTRVGTGENRVQFATGRGDADGCVREPKRGDI